MPHEVFPSAESEHIPEQSFETANEIGSRLLEVGWTEKQVGNFPVAMQKMADAMARGNDGSTAGKIHFALNVTKDKNGGEVAEVTLVGEGEGLTPERISELIEKDELPVALLTGGSTQFFADENKVVLRREKDLAVEEDGIK